MAFRSWVRLLGTTLGVGALAGACQLGLAYGLGIVRLTRVVDVTTRDQWTAQLAWVTWFAMVAAVVGALVGSWLLPAWGPSGATTAPSTTGAEDGDGAARPPVLGAGTIIALGVAAGIGAAVVVPLTMQPARTAQIAGVNPVVVIAICATLGAVVGIFAACAAVAQPVSRWNLVAVSIAVWVIAIVSVAPSLAPSDPLPAVRLGVFDADFLSSSTTQRTALFTMPALALLAGAALGWRARRQERPVLTIALAGLPGPALLTLAYLIAGPGSGTERYQIVPYWAAMTATGAGVLGSVLAAVLRRGSGADEPDESGRDDATEDPPSLPRRPNEPKSEIARAAEAPTQFTPSARKGSSSAATPAPAGPGDDPRAGTLRPSDTAVFDTPSGQVRPAPGSSGPRAAPWSPSAGGASAPLGSPAPQSPGGHGTGAVDSFPVRGGERPESTGGRSATAAAPGRPGGVALGEYAGPEPTAFDGFARGEAKHSRQIHSPGHHTTPEHAGNPDRFTPPGAALPGLPPPGGAVSGWSSPEASSWSSPGGLNLDLTAPGRRASDHAQPYVPEPATRPLPPEVLGQPTQPQPSQPQPARGGALRGLRSLGRARAGGPAMDLPLPGRTTVAGQDRPTTGAHASNPDPTTERATTTERANERANEPTTEATNRRRSRRAPLVPEPHAVSAPLPHPTPISPPLPQPKPLTPPRQSGPPTSMPDGRHAPAMPDSRHSDAPAEDGRFSFGKPHPAERTARSASAPADARPTTPTAPPTTPADPQGHHAADPGPAGSGRRSRFGLKKQRKDNADYVDWVSGLGNDPS
jgi:hypothetical protein